MSAIQLRITDETFAGKILNEISISLASELVTVKDIIEARVNREVQDYNQKLPEVYRGLIQPNNAEAILNGFKMKSHKPVDAEKQVYTALNAFQNNGFFMLIDQKQAETLEEEVLLKPDTIVSFVKLTPLVGG